MLSSNNLKMEVNNQGEEDFFLSHLRPNMRVLEFGSGISTITIAPLVKELVSIEHDSKWYAKTKSMLPNGSNVTLCYIAPNQPPTQDYDDGTYEDFKNYVPNALVLVEKFDLVFIDGRARVACAEQSAKHYLKPGGIIIIHDIMHPNPKYRRYEYDKVLDFLEHVDGVFAMHSFKVKGTNNESVS